MRHREGLIVTALILLLLIFWLGFLFHSSDTFAGTLIGNAFGITGAVLMLVPLGIYMAVKRQPILRKWVTRRISLEQLLLIHIYTALSGAILVVIHTGHKFYSPLGITLTSTVLVVSLSGYVGRYLLMYLNQGIQEKQNELSELNLRLKRLLQYRRLYQRPGINSPIRRLSHVIADIETAVTLNDKLTAWFQRWHKFHQVIASALVLMLGFHVSAGIYYGLRWLSEGP
ncbi:Uncharacterised protein [BD1-7 clade bacterium]|uniref:Uncharacterized protein n=1 Tax=BD1-7 clade bacterium TaxID=2029982 RepID=A0A5S9P7V8_9GAMM|nr:Uncharacterised protein [BD1-7 clade bacterium]CAA0099662.1 Uncharacterised protein [BD1-7 clade bacterium]